MHKFVYSHLQSKKQFTETNVWYNICSTQILCTTS